MDFLKKEIGGMDLAVSCFVILVVPSQIFVSELGSGFSSIDQDQSVSDYQLLLIYWD